MRPGAVARDGEPLQAARRRARGRRSETPQSTVQLLQAVQAEMEQSMHVKAALMFNNLIKKNGLKNIQPIKNGDKIKVVYLKTPNPINNNAIAAPDVLPAEYGLEKYIDREKQFATTFLDPLTNITNTIGWETEKKVTLDSFF
jgi:DNA polymerase elongation subunit (family B)